MSPATASELYVGLMSGTSLDGVDVAIVDFAAFPPGVIHCTTSAYPRTMRDNLRRLAQVPTTSLDRLFGLDAELAEFYAQAVQAALDDAGIESASIAAIGCHGQTIRHSPDTTPAYTAQIGDPGRLAVRTGITTVADFRRKDVALGGQGAPLASAFHRFLFRSDTENRVVINIGGIANVTYLPADSTAPILGFDTGPGNTLLDHWIGRQRNLDCDVAGEWARSGRAIDSLLGRMLSEEPYFALPPPKSTGTEYFSPAWLASYLQAEQAPQDVQATLAELTAVTLARAIRRLPAMPAGCFVCGGGAHNRYLLERLADAMPECEIETTAALGLDPDYVEAVAFAWLARERIQRRPGNDPAVTRATRETTLGGVYLAQ